MVPPLKQLHGCTIRNQTNDCVDALVVYKKLSDDQTGSHEFFRRAQIPKASSFRSGMQVVEAAGYQISLPIECIQITYSNGKSIGIEAPFSGVSTVEHDWLFIIDNDGIKSVKRHE